MAVEFKSSTPNTRTRPVYIRFDDLTLTLLETVAQEHGLTRSELMRRATAEYVRRLAEQQSAPA